MEQRRAMSAIKWAVLAAILFLLIRFVLRPDITVLFGLSLSPLWYQLAWALLGALGVWFCRAVYLNSKRAQELKSSHDRLRDSLMRYEQELRTELGQLKGSITELKFAAVRAEGKFRFTKDMALTEALAIHPDVAKILFTRGLACISCPSAAAETLEQAAAAHGLNVQPILDDLNKLLGE